MEMQIKEKSVTVEEYFAGEETSVLRHEFINGQLFEMPGGTKKHNLLVSKIQRLLEDIFVPTHFLIYRENMKVKIANESKYYYPDVFITKESEIDSDPYVCHEPELIVEVSSESTIKTDSVDKLINYQKIPSLQYYLLVDPEKIDIALFTKDIEGGWLSEAFQSAEDTIVFSKLNASLPVKHIYTQLLV
jgi:Uma2 family endonuclease